jgi:hypothetical protein
MEDVEENLKAVITIVLTDIWRTVLVPIEIL